MLFNRRDQELLVQGFNTVPVVAFGSVHTDGRDLAKVLLVKVILVKARAGG